MGRAATSKICDRELFAWRAKIRIEPQRAQRERALSIKKQASSSVISLPLWLGLAGAAIYLVVVNIVLATTIVSKKILVEGFQRSGGRLSRTA